MYHKPRYRHRQVCFLTEDAAALTIAMRARFPDLRFVPYHYDWAIDKMEHNPETGQLEPTYKAGDRTLRYVDGLADPASHGTYAWIEPPGWQPEWMDREELGKLLDGLAYKPDFHFYRRTDLITNLPPRCILFDRSEFIGNEMRHGEISVDFGEHQDERLAFFTAVLEIVESMSNPYLQPQQAPGEPESARPPALHSRVWVGPQARAWLAADPRRTTSHFMWPPIAYYAPPGEPPPPPKPKRRPKPGALPGERASWRAPRAG